MKRWVATYVDRMGRIRKIWFRAETLIHACARARRIMDYFSQDYGWTIVEVERRY